MNLVHKLSQCNCKYGAPMGRANKGSPDDTKLYLRRVVLDAGGYDSGGAYWGLPASRLYRYYDASGEVEGFVHAFNRRDAKARISEDYPYASFYRCS